VFLAPPSTQARPADEQQAMGCKALGYAQVLPASWPLSHKKFVTVGGRPLTLPAVGTADLREAPAKLLQASAEAIVLSRAARQ
jgi:hypothetical protein